MNFKGHLWFLCHTRRCVASFKHRYVVEGRNLEAEEQGGFRRGRRCRHQLLTLGLLGQMKMLSRMFAGFIDFRKANDRVDREK